MPFDSWLEWRPATSDGSTAILPQLIGVYSPDISRLPFSTRNPSSPSVSRARSPVPGVTPCTDRSTWPSVSNRIA